MLDKYLNKKVTIEITRYGSAANFIKGEVTDIDKDFIEINNNIVIQIKYIVSIEAKN